MSSLSTSAFQTTLSNHSSHILYEKVHNPVLSLSSDPPPPTKKAKYSSDDELLTPTQLLTTQEIEGDFLTTQEIEDDFTVVNDGIAVNVNEVTNDFIMPEDFKSNEKNQENEKDKFSDSDKDVKPSSLILIPPLRRI